MGRLWQKIRTETLWRVLWVFSTAIAHTVRIRALGIERLERLRTSGDGGIVALWHGTTMLPIFYCRHRGLWAIVSLSRDGELQNRLVTSRGYQTIRGSTGPQGVRAFLEAVKRINRGAVIAITPDGPRGPAKIVQAGTVLLAERAGCEVLPLGVACQPAIRLRSWDSHMIPLPFSRAVLVFGQPLRIGKCDSDEERQSWAEAIARSLEKTVADANAALQAQENRGMHTLYNLILLALSPVLAGYYAWRVFGSRKSRRAWRQQLGLVPESVRQRSERPRAWIHAVSVGEAVASAPIFRELRRLVPDAEMVVSTMTTTGQEMARKSIPEAEHAIYFPLDIPSIVRRYISTVKPDVFVSVESEIWPNFLAAAHARNIPVLMVNGIVSDRTVRWGRRLRPLYRWALSKVDRFLMQTPADADRIIALGAPPERVEVVGNCKFDQESDALAPNEADEIRQRFGFANGRRVLVAGSTNPGEDGPVLTAFQIARESHPDLRLVLAPRQIERADSIDEMVRTRGLSCGRRSAAGSLTGSEDVVILDTFGELASVYGICDVAFVGGSLIRKGGHNILQPMAHGKPVFFGPHMFKARDLVAQAKAAGVGFEVKDGEDLGRRVASLLSDPEVLADIRERALEIMRRNRGASRRCAEAIAEALGAR